MWESIGVVWEVPGPRSRHQANHHTATAAEDNNNDVGLERETNGVGLGIAQDGEPNAGETKGANNENDEQNGNTEPFVIDMANSNNGHSANSGRDPRQALPSSRIRADAMLHR